jgi:hypothetical protein
LTEISKNGTKKERKKMHDRKYIKEREKKRKNQRESK